MPPDFSAARRARARSSSRRSTRRRVLLLLQRRALDLELHDAALDFVDLLRHRVDLDAQPRRGFVDQIDRLVGEEAVADVAMRERRRGDDRVVGDAHAVVRLVALLEAAQDGDGALDVGSPTYTGWKRRSSAASFSTCLRYSSSVVAPTTRSSPRASIGLSMLPASIEPSALPGADERVQLVDEDDELPFGVGDLLEHGLEPLLELAAELGAGDQRAEVERDEPLVLERSRARRR